MTFQIILQQICRSPQSRDTKMYFILVIMTVIMTCDDDNENSSDGDSDVDV